MPPSGRASSGETVAPFGAELRSQAGADAGGKAGAGAAGGDGQQQIAAPDLGHVVEVAQLRAVLDVDQHPLGPRQVGQFGGRVVGQPDDPEGAQAGQIGPARKVAPQRGTGRLVQVSSGWSENNSGSRAPPARNALKRRTAAGPRPATAMRQSGGVQCDRYHRRPAIRRRMLSRVIGTPALLCSGLQCNGQSGR